MITQHTPAMNPLTEPRVMIQRVIKNKIAAHDVLDPQGMFHIPGLQLRRVNFGVRKEIRQGTDTFFFQPHARDRRQVQAAAKNESGGNQRQMIKLDRGECRLNKDKPGHNPRHAFDTRNVHGILQI